MLHTQPVCTVQLYGHTCCCRRRCSCCYCLPIRSRCITFSSSHTSSPRDSPPQAEKAQEAKASADEKRAQAAARMKKRQHDVKEQEDAKKAQDKVAVSSGCLQSLCRHLPVIPLIVALIVAVSSQVAAEAKAQRSESHGSTAAKEATILPALNSAYCHALKNLVFV